MEMEILGWIAGICSFAKSVPQAWRSFQDGHSKGLSPSSLWIWVIGLIAATIYIYDKSALPLFLSYLGNSFFLAVMLRYKYFPRKRGKFKKLVTR